MVVGSEPAHAEKTYTIGTVDTFEPFEIQDKNGTYNGKNPGIEIEMLREIAKHEGFKYNLKIMSFNATLTALEAGQIDASMGGMSVTDERKAKIDFSKSYYTDGVVMAVPENSKITKLSQLKGKTVDVKSGTSSAIYANSVKDKYGFKVKYFNTSNTMWNDVMNGNAAATFDDGPVLQYGIRNGIKLKIVTKEINSTPVAIGVKKGQNQELLNKLNDGITWLKETGRMQKIINKYTKGDAAKTETDSDRGVWGLIKSNKDALLSGLGETLLLTVVGVALALLFGGILGVMGISDRKIFSSISSVIIYIFRGMPMIVLAFFIYIGMPSVIGHKIPLFTAGILTLMLDEGAYVGAIVKGGFQAVDRGQWEAARSLGLPYYKTLVKVIMPQGIKIMVPSLVNQLIITLKDTSILSAIGVMELTQTGTVIIARNMEGFKIWLIIGVIYIIIITLLTWLSNYVQRKMA
ncbi:ABC transporter substrate-binding protein/permease [Limosilactobacillus fermentum]|uniref:ABC transporter substrate-binding protein/permease n=1 Tax=Limosilactobacillus fermentum TaxID=1613 RepID=UPI0021A70162|nr:ABC transporter substrate-binding protein/permease [Limosilactobacillus fermentum]